MDELEKLFDTIKGINSNNSKIDPNAVSAENKTTCRPIENIILDNANIKLSFWGSFKAGKSSLINTLIRREILPVRSTSATGCVTRIFYSDDEYAKVIYKNGTIINIPIEEVGNYILICKKTIDEVIVLDDILRVDIGLNDEILQSLDIYDLPGDEDDIGLTQISYSISKKMDIVIFVLSAIRLFSDKEKSTIEDLYRCLNGNLAFVINKLDFINENDLCDIEEVVDYFLADKFSKNIQLNIHYCSSNDAKIGINKLRDTLSELKEEPYWILKNNIFKHITNLKTK